MYDIPVYMLVPFVLMLGAIAVMPLFAEHFWEKNSNKLIVALILGIPTAIWLIANEMHIQLEHTLIFDYIPFLILLGALFIITGGIFVGGNIEASPKNNAIILAIGAILASFMGTTGASMLLIRPIININKERQFKVHTILFFIGIVANCGGLLTPLGDPPLFMMYLRGVPFEWFFKLGIEWLFVNSLLVILYIFVDNYFWKKESQDSKHSDIKNKEPISINGKLNFLWLAGVVAAVAFINTSSLSFVKAGELSSYLREGAIMLMAVCSMVFTKKQNRVNNNFNWSPIVEVAYLFLGIFITMVPCLLYLELNAETLGINTAPLFYYSTGSLSSFLDNTPTAVTFYSLAMGLFNQNPAAYEGMAIVGGIPEILMYAICTGAVFFGSMTYIGNGPNFMVKSIAEAENIKMPHFFAYMYKFSLIILLPLFILTQLLFIR